MRPLFLLKARVTNYLLDKLQDLSVLTPSISLHVVIESLTFNIVLTSINLIMAALCTSTKRRGLTRQFFQIQTMVPVPSIWFLFTRNGNSNQRRMPANRAERVTTL